MCMYILVFSRDRRHTVNLIPYKSGLQMLRSIKWGLDLFLCNPYCKSGKTESSMTFPLTSMGRMNAPKLEVYNWGLLKPPTIGFLNTKHEQSRL